MYYNVMYMTLYCNCLGSSGSGPGKFVHMWHCLQQRSQVGWAPSFRAGNCNCRWVTEVVLVLIISLHDIVRYYRLTGAVSAVLTGYSRSNVSLCITTSDQFNYWVDPCLNILPDILTYYLKACRYRYGIDTYNVMYR